MNLWLGLLAAYIAGSFPTAYLVGRSHGVDLKTVGSGNYGATNVYRTLGVVPALIALVVDVGKGAAPVLLIPRWLPAPDINLVTYGVLLAVAATLGHVFSVFLRFKGGKGVGTAAGAFGALSPWATVVALGAWLIVILWRRIVSLASMTAAVALLLAVAGLHAHELPGSWPLISVTALLAVFVFWTHRDNIRRLRRGEERPVFAERPPPDDEP